MENNNEDNNVLLQTLKENPTIEDIRNVDEKIREFLSNQIVPIINEPTSSTERIIRNNTRKKILKCPECDFTGTHYFEMKAHKSKAHKIVAEANVGPDSILCDACEFVAENAASLRQHKETKHKPKKYKCTSCEYSSQYPSHLASHVRSKHTQEKPFKCPLCDFRTVQSSHLKPHYLSKHSSLKPYKCDVCAYCTAHAGNLKSHILKRHTEDLPHKCQYCPYASAYPGHLRNHIMLRHTSERPHKCSFCPYSTGQVAQLRAHVLAKHTNLKPYACHICSYASATQGSLKYHLKTRHTESLPEPPSEPGQPSETAEPEDDPADLEDGAEEESQDGQEEEEVELHLQPPITEIKTEEDYCFRRGGSGRARWWLSRPLERRSYGDTEPATQTSRFSYAVPEELGPFCYPDRLSVLLLPVSGCRPQAERSLFRRDSLLRSETSTAGSDTPHSSGPETRHLHSLPKRHLFYSYPKE